MVLTIIKVVAWTVGIVIGLAALNNVEQFTQDPMSTVRKGTRDIIDVGLDKTLGEGFDEPEAPPEDWDDYYPPEGKYNNESCRWVCEYRC